MTDPLPEWITPRDTQLKAVDEIVDAFESGSRVVFLDGPTGSGKTIIGELVRRRLDVPTLYMCSDRNLQDQFARDFPYGKVLKGRSNYQTQHELDKTCDECLGEVCFMCDHRGACPYVKAKTAAIASELAVVNTSYFLHEANYVGEIGGRRGLIIADEGDVLESSLMGFVRYDSPEWLMKSVGMEAPGKGVRKKRLVAWLNDFADTILKNLHKWDGDVKRKNSAYSAVQSARTVASELQLEVDEGTDSEDAGRWLREYKTRWSGGRYVDDGVLRLAPVLVAPYGFQYLWRHAKRWLVMSATIIAAEELVESLGVGMDWSYVSTPMTFPVENRQIVMAPVANVVRSEMDSAVDKLANAIINISEMHEGERVLVHTVSFDLTKRLFAAVDGRLPNHTPYQYLTGGQVKERALYEYLRDPSAMLFAPSMERGVDLVGDKCRVQVVAKVPFPSLGDRRVSARLHLPGGDVWYQVQAVRNLVQMTGRAVRGPDDWAVTYVLDRQFATNLYRKSNSLFPKWWRDAVVTSFNTTQLTRVAA